MSSDADLSAMIAQVDARIQRCEAPAISDSELPPHSRADMLLTFSCPAARRAGADRNSFGRQSVRFGMRRFTV